MKIRLFVVLLLLSVTAKVARSSPYPGRFLQGFDKNMFYKILKTGTIGEIGQELSHTETLAMPERGAYQGALLMKEAGLLQKPREKLERFKSGRIRLETAIHADSSNVEFRFLRLIIQEHAPKITKYHDQVKEDSELIRRHYKELPVVLQEMVKDYSRSSPALTGI